MNERLQSWGFNTVQIGAYGDDYPFISDSNFPIDSKGLHTNPVKMPFIVEVRGDLLRHNQSLLWRLAAAGIRGEKYDVFAQSLLH